MGNRFNRSRRKPLAATLVIAAGLLFSGGGYAVATNVAASNIATEYTAEQISLMAAYVASLAPGPAIPEQKYLEATGDATHGGELFRINCAMCHNAVGAAGALTEGKYAPNLNGVEAKHVYEAMLIGPQNMPVFNDANITPQDKQDIITYLAYIEENPSAGGFELGSLGPVAEGLFIWIFGLGLIIAITVWLGAKSN